MHPAELADRIIERLDALACDDWTVTASSRAAASTGSVYLDVSAENDATGETRSATARISDHDPNMSVRGSVADVLIYDDESAARAVARIMRALGLGRPRYRTWRVVGTGRAYATRAEALAAARELATVSWMAQHEGPEAAERAAARAVYRERLG